MTERVPATRWDPSAKSERRRPRVVIVGGGFAGLHATKALARAPVDITLIDRRNFHLFQPLLYQVATGGLSPADIAYPLRRMFRRHQNVRVLMGEVTNIDLQSRRVRLEQGDIPYDRLIVATGSVDHYFGNDEWREIAPGLKTVEDATEIRRKVLRAFEAAERCADAAERRSLLRFVIVGAGPTGVELAGAIAELANDALRGDFRTIDPGEASILLVEGLDRVLPSYPPSLSKRAQLSLEKLGVAVRTKTLATAINTSGVLLKGEDGKHTEISAKTVLWSAGVRASDLGNTIGAQSSTGVDKQGRLAVSPDLSLADRPDVFVVGDLASFRPEADADPVPALASVAIRQGRHAARQIRRDLDGKPRKPFHYRHRGTLSTIGRAAAVADFGFVRFSGYPAWLLWIFVHILYLIGFENRVLVVVQWAWNYVTRNRSARLITSRSHDYTVHEAIADERPHGRAVSGGADEQQDQRTHVAATTMATHSAD